MEIAGYRLRDRGARCQGPVTVHRAEVSDRPGQLVRLTCVKGTPGSPLLTAAVAAWQEVRHPALLQVAAVERSGDLLLLRSPGATARPLDTLAPAALSVPPPTVARIGEGIAEGLAVLHLCGRTHGSVSAHTILLGSEGTAVLDGPWHVACRVDEQAADDLGAAAPDDAATPSDAPAPDDAARDVRALAATLLDLLDATEQRRPAPHHAGSRSAGSAPLRRATGSAPVSADVDALRAVLRTTVHQPGTAPELQQALRGWRMQVPPTPAEPRSTPPVDRERAAWGLSGGVTALRPSRHRGRATGVANRDRSPLRLCGSPVGAGLAGVRASLVRPLSLAIIAGAVALGVLAVLGAAVLARPAPPTIAPPTAAAQAATSTATSGPSRGTTSAPASGTTGQARSTAATALPGRATPASDRRPVCPGSSAPPGRGSLVLADLDGRGCRAAARLDGDRLSTQDVDGTVIEVVLGLRPGDQVRIADLDGTGRDEVVVYRPGTGEVFRFAALAGPGEVLNVRGRTSGRIGGTAVVVRDSSGVDRLEFRGGSPA